MQAFLPPSTFRQPLSKPQEVLSVVTLIRSRSDINTVLGKICDPYLNLFKKFIPPIGGMVDVSPIVALLVLQFGVRLLIGLL